MSEKDNPIVDEPTERPYPRTPSKYALCPVWLPRHLLDKRYTGTIEAGRLATNLENTAVEDLLAIVAKLLGTAGAVTITITNRTEEVPDDS